jgi:hypothetical protein
VKRAAWPWLVLLLLPGCILVQPLDEATPDSVAGAERAGSAGSAAAGNSGGGPSKPGSGGAGRGGATGAGGAPIGGGGPIGGAFSLFIGTWTLVDGQNTTTCEPGTTQTSALTPGEQVNFGRGTITDLILDPGKTCEVLADVDDHTAFLNSNTERCMFSDDTFAYDIYVDAFEFVVSDDAQTASASMTAYLEVTDADNNTSNCQSDTTWNYER